MRGAGARFPCGCLHLSLPSPPAEYDRESCHAAALQQSMAAALCWDHTCFEIAGVRQAPPRPIVKGADLPRRRSSPPSPSFPPANAAPRRLSDQAAAPAHRKQRAERQVCGKP